MRSRPYFFGYTDTLALPAIPYKTFEKLVLDGDFSIFRDKWPQLLEKVRQFDRVYERNASDAGDPGGHEDPFKKAYLSTKTSEKPLQNIEYNPSHSGLIYNDFFG